MLASGQLATLLLRTLLVEIEFNPRTLADDDTVQCQGQTRRYGALAFRIFFSARRKRREHGDHGEGFMLLAESLTVRASG